MIQTFLGSWVTGVDDLNALLRPSFGSEQWILEGWHKITVAEKKLISDRVERLFQHGLPFELKHDKLLYIYTFSLLAQLEVLAIQVPLNFEEKMTTPAYKKRMHLQLLDEIFHSIVFTKIVYLLCAPYALPPAYNENIEVLCNFIRQEKCPKVAIMLLNLVGEGWIEEIFYSLERQGIATTIFKTILADEHRHVNEADLYQDIGLPDVTQIHAKLNFLETQLLTNIFMQYKYMISISTLLGVTGSQEFICALNNKHQQQLKKINLKPSDNWQLFMRFASDLLPKIVNFSSKNKELTMTPIRQVLMTQWQDPSDPTMVGQFDINVTCLDFFNKKFPKETLTTLMLQTISLGLAETASFRSYLSLKKLYQTTESYVSLVVKLPNCGDHIGSIIFENCHNLSVHALSTKIRHLINMMVYCFKKREQLEKIHPHLVDIFNDVLFSFSNDCYSYPILGNPFVSVSNIGFCGYSQSVSPLRCNEAMKFTLNQVERKLIWQQDSQTFESEDMLPVSISADHRIFDGNLPAPKMINGYFKTMFTKFIDEPPSINKSPPVDSSQLTTMLEQLINQNTEIGYKILLLLQTYWFDFIVLDDLVTVELLNHTVKQSNS